jgi:CDP-diacylglycerol---glycerol-3-phosphate 3-phosphatidyltransferase
MARSEALGRVKEGYTSGTRRVAARWMGRLARTRVTPNALTAGGVLLCAAGAVTVYFEDRGELAAYWIGAALFIVGSILDILDGALARSSGKATPFGAFVDSMTDRISEGVMLGAIALVFMRAENEIAVGVAFAALAGSFLVSYTRARAEALGLSGKVGVGTRAERVALITTGLGLEALLPFTVLPWAIALLAAAAWFTVVQRILFVRTQLRRR